MAQPIEAFRNAFKIPELKRRLLFTLIMVAIYRLGCYVPTPGIDGSKLADQFGRGGILGFYDLFSGGAFSQATVFALGIMPYISASIIVSLLIPVIPSLEKLSKTGHEGQKKITEYTRYGTIGLCIIQSIAIAVMLQGMPEVVARPGVGFIMMCVLSFTTGTAFIMWLGEQISESGIGNGISLIIFISIISRAPAAIGLMFRMIRNDQLGVLQAGMLVILMVIVVAAAIVITTGQRRIPVQYPRQVKGRKIYGGQRNYLPLRVNQAGVIPIIFASSIMMLPSMLQNAVPVVGDFMSRHFMYGGLAYNMVDAILIIFFSFFYTAITFNPVEIADNMKKYGGVIMGVRPGRATADYLYKVMNRITLVGSLFLALIALLPNIVSAVVRVNDPSHTLLSFFGGTTLLILVGVALDTVRQIEQHLIMRSYDGFAGAGRRIRARRG
ncbi:MAG: preprotein translocase subunit SecY [Candidatus Hydrogenedentes bacterium]|nr:preprotein translocase subunit SecY [Candidatus Hydrogenedentota bacterium]